ncbi:rhomboid family intramembrane serine protease GlpG [Parashewanella spongiae]|uniref:Rhomboid family intramembrane serine protease GlpG n=1 Tax=Parashewanella spongiae TaxID=342950 RepID=A0A3A6TPZ3_9GAMM|nr:rhomboid family intramembrane serine protease GlpG [Parashewanella spongiae]MCL1078542.1 rhomboid family intramembrane serine protease GlpG [Parashewanella spongiae]RJY13314.1 rhomboid family intramembrane serine protease GlpG [Parashewanella spongiae]
MIEIGEIPNLRAAQAYSDYLKSQGIKCVLEPIPQGVIILVATEDDAEIAHKVLEHFLSHPNDPRYLQASWEHGDTRNKIEYTSSSRPIIKQFLANSGPLTFIIFISCILIFGLMNLGFASQMYSAFSYFGATANNQANEFWRFFTPSLLHFSLIHILSNLLWWWYFGGKIERYLGLTKLLTLLIVAGTLPNVVQYFLAGPNFGGLSGVVYALIAYVAVLSVRRPDCGIQIQPALVVITIVWMVLGFSQALPTATANGAHLAGFIIGLVQGWIDSRKSPSR